MSRRLEDPDDPRWLEAERRLVFLRGLLKANGWTATREVVEATRHEFRIGRSTVYRMIARFRASRKASSSDPNRPRHPRRRQALGYQDRTPYRPRDRPLLVEEGEAKDECLDFDGCRRYLSDRRASAASSQHHPAPRWDELDALGTARRRGEVLLEAEVTPSVSSFHAERPNDVWQIDHTIVDLIVVDEETRLPIGRPYLTIAVDICTRMVAGFHLSLDAPSSVSVGLCILHAAYDKTSWLQERGVEHPWPVAGLPSVLQCDNGPEFHSRALKAACHEYGIKLVYRPPATTTLRRSH